MAERRPDHGTGIVSTDRRNVLLGLAASVAGPGVGGAGAVPGEAGGTSGGAAEASSTPLPEHGGDAQGKRGQEGGGHGVRGYGVGGYGR